VVIVGLGNLGHALANYGGFGERGFPIAALVDADERVVGTTINGVVVRHIDELPQIAQEHGIAIGIIATPAHAAQEVADRLIAAGITSVLNFAPTHLSVPEEVSLRKVDLAVELQILSFYQRRKATDGQRTVDGLPRGGGRGPSQSQSQSQGQGQGPEAVSVDSGDGQS
ncbi:MAG TPA: redox-sensing transcriptional repressor Rex, partial [Acidimicrobiales bacterium]